MKIFVLIWFLIDPQLLLGFWNLKFAEANFNIVNSPAFEASTKVQQDEFLVVNELYLKNAYYEFKKDTVYSTDVNPRKKLVVLKKGKWNLVGDTLNIYDYEKVFAYKFLVSVRDNELNLIIIFPDGSVSRSKNIYERKIEN